MRPSSLTNTSTSLGLESGDLQKVHDLVLEGFRFSALTRFERESRLPKEAIHEVLQLPARTLARRKESGRLNPDESDRLFRLANLYAQTVSLFEGDSDAARRWLQTPRELFGNRTPLELARTEVGTRQVEDLILRLEHGVFS